MTCFIIRAEASLLKPVLVFVFVISRFYPDVEKVAILWAVWINAGQVIGQENEARFAYVVLSGYGIL
jgi:hypothetical protein